MSRNTRWEEVLGNPGGDYTAQDALEDIGGSLDSSESEVAELVKKFCQNTWAADEQLDDDDHARIIARDLLGDILANITSDIDDMIAAMN